MSRKKQRVRYELDSGDIKSLTIEGQQAVAQIL